MFSIFATLKRRLMLPVLNLPFVGSTSTWAVAAKSGVVLFEACGPYQRRTFRTRTTILSPSGPLDISVPVYTGHNLMYADARVNYETSWDRQMLYALRTAYNSSPYFEYMYDDIASIIQHRYKFLWDLNLDMFRVIDRILELNININLTTEFTHAPSGSADYRIAIEPKYAHLLDDACVMTPYSQVFSTPYTERPFTPALSMFDMMFNMGPESRDVLRQMVADAI